AVALRDFRVPGDFRAKIALYRLVNPVAWTVEQLTEWERATPGDAVQYRRVAEDGAGRAVAYAEAVRMPWNKPGRFGVDCITAREFRRQGIGSALLTDVERLAGARGAAELLCEINEQDSHSLAFAERRGYRRDGHLFESVLDLTRWDGKRFAGVIGTVERGGIRFFALADSATERNRHKLYNLVRETAADVPDLEGGFPDYQHWLALNLEGENCQPDCIQVAADGDRFVGVAHVAFNPETGDWQNEYTAVLPEYRGREIGLACRLLAIRAALRHGARSLRTHNDSRLPSLLALNGRLGYVPRVGCWRLVKR
ncbi:MAG: GNAT family N-acetyltransferase, partial [Mycobacterium leprae]